MRFPTESDPELLAACRRFVTSGDGEERRYFTLFNGYLLDLPPDERAEFVGTLAEDARQITDHELSTLLDSEWRSRITAAWLIALDRRTGFRDRLGRMLLASEVVFSGQGYCFAFARFGEARDAEILVEYLDHYLPLVDCVFDQDWAIGALLHLDARLGTTHAQRFLVPGGLWARSAMKDRDPDRVRLRIDRLSALAETAMRTGSR